MIFSSPIHWPANFVKSLFLLHCVKVPTTFSVPIPLFFPASGYYKYGCYEHSEAGVLVICWNIFWVYAPGGISGSSGNTMSNFLRTHKTDFQSGCNSLQSHQQWRIVPLSPHPRQCQLSPEFLIVVILTGVRWNFSVV
jgi:hypothetical protein